MKNKNLLAENMLRFRAKNLSETTRRKIVKLAEIITEQAPDGYYTREYVTIGSALVKTIPTSDGILRFTLGEIYPQKAGVFIRQFQSLLKSDADFDRAVGVEIAIRNPIKFDNGADRKIYSVKDRNTISIVRGFHRDDWNGPADKIKELLYNMFKDFVAPPAVPTTPQNLKP